MEFEVEKILLHEVMRSKFIPESKYKNLCSLCGSPAGCYEGDRYYGMQGAINCLLENVGDVAWVGRSSATRYFSVMMQFSLNL